MTRKEKIVLNCLTTLLFLLEADGFLSPAETHQRWTSVSRRLTDSNYEVPPGIDVVGDDVVRSPLRFLGPYPTMPLRFPRLATASQRARNVTGVSLDFVLDTAANTNTINAQVASELELEKVGEAPGGVGAAGDLIGGDTFLLGDVELDIQRESDIRNDSFIFMQGLTASALPVASPAAAGLLSLSFFYCFVGGVEFKWGDQTSPPSITFYGSDKHLDFNGMARVPFESLPVSILPSVTISVNGFEIPALFDTGSPITVLNAAAAEAAGIEMAIDLTEPTDDKDRGWNPFSKMKASFQHAQELASATSRGDILTIAGNVGKPVRLVKSKGPQTLYLKAETFNAPAREIDGNQYTTVGINHVYVGDLPGLAALGGLGGDAAPPAAVLGMDFLRLRPRVLFRAQQKEIYL